MNTNIFRSLPTLRYCYITQNKLNQLFQLGTFWECSLFIGLYSEVFIHLLFCQISFSCEVLHLSGYPFPSAFFLILCACLPLPKARFTRNIGEEIADKPVQWSCPALREFTLRNFGRNLSEGTCGMNCLWEKIFPSLIH